MSASGRRAFSGAASPLRKNFTATGNVAGRTYSSIFSETSLRSRVSDAMIFIVSSPGRARPGAAVVRAMTAVQAQALKRRMRLYNAEWCWYCQRVRKKLDELGLDYDVVEVPIRHSERKDVMRISGH